MYDEYKTLEESLDRQGISLRFSEMTFKQIGRALTSGNVSSTPLRDLSLNFFSMVSRYAYSIYKVAPETPMIPFESNGHLYSLSYSDGMTRLNCHRCDIEPSEINKIEKSWNSVFNSIRNHQGKEFYALFREGGASIINHFGEDISQLSEMEDEIDSFFSSSTTDSKLRDDVILMWELMAPRKANKTISFKIKTYILSVFSFLEYSANCILPFWNEMNLPEWNRFMEICGYKNDRVRTWMDLYDPEKTKVKITSSQNKKEEKPEDISIVDVFFSSLPDTEKKLVDEFRKLKKSYRNVLAHGELGKLNLHGLSPVYRDLDSYNGNVYYQSFFVEDMDRHAFMRVRHFTDDFLSMVEKLYPTVMLFLRSEQDIPGRPIEFVSLCGNDSQKAEAYLNEMKLRDLFDFFEWRLETFRPSDELEAKRIVSEFADSLADFNPVFKKTDDLPEILYKLVYIENGYLIQFDRYCAMSKGGTELVHYGKRAELEASGINWEDFIREYQGCDD